MTDRERIERIAAGRPIIAIDHPRVRLDGALGIHERDGRITAISAHRCGLGALPDLTALDALERLDAGGNELDELPELPSSLRELYVYDNRLTSLPTLPRLRVLDANRNRLARVPAL